MKIASTPHGITGIQADIKIRGLPVNIVYECILRANSAKKQIFHIMRQCIETHNTQKKKCWPVTKELKVDPAKRTKFIGLSGRNLKRFYMENGVQITEHEPCQFSIFAPSQVAMNEVDEAITSLLEADEVPELEFGGVYTAKIVDIRENGVMVKLYESMAPTLIHVSQLDVRRVASPKVLGLEVGQEIKVKYFGADPVSGYFRLSRKVLMLAASDSRSLVFGKS